MPAKIEALRHGLCCFQQVTIALDHMQSRLNGSEQFWWERPRHPPVPTPRQPQPHHDYKSQHHIKVETTQVVVVWVLMGLNDFDPGRSHDFGMFKTTPHNIQTLHCSAGSPSVLWLPANNTPNPHIAEAAMWTFG